jgi:hypothetical protein
VTFSLRLTADLALALCARVVGDARSPHPILHLSPDTDFQTVSASSFESSAHLGEVSSHCGALVPRYRSPIIWIGGAEPLDHPDVARFANALVASGRSVFLETSGAALNRRLHEFKPSSRFYFSVRFDNRDPSPMRREARDGAFPVAPEAIRMAHLAGFFVCARLVLHPDTVPGALVKLHAEIRKFGVDGFVITAAAGSPELATAADQVRRRLLSRRWALLSSLLDESAAARLSRDSAEIERRLLPETEPDDFGEGAAAG